jgi:acyl-CoA hydrolase
MYTEEEKQYLELTAKLQGYLESIDEEIIKLTERKERLQAVLNGTASIKADEEKQYLAEFVEKQPKEPTRKPAVKKGEPTRNVVQHRQVRFVAAHLKRNPGLKRSELVEQLPRIDAKALGRILENGKRRGVFVVEGRAKAARWYAAETS